MPNLRALPMLCCLLFAPMVELRVNPSFTRYSGALCGLGYDRETRKSYYEASDVSIVFDHEITEEDLEFINRLRFRLNSVINPRTQTSSNDLVKSLKQGLKK